MSNKLFDNFKLNFPLLAIETNRYYETSKYNLAVELQDGTRVLYDDWDGTIRNLPTNSDNLTESEFGFEFGMRLRRLMSRKGVTQMVLSELTGIPQSMISLYMNGKNTPSFYKVDKIAKALNCSVDEFRYT